MPSTPTCTPAAEPPDPTTLDTVISASAGPYPVVLLPAEAVTAVVLSHQHGTAKLLLPDGTIRREPLDRPAFLITDPGREAPLLRQATTWFSQQSHRNRMLLDGERRDHGTRLREIRDYAVARHREGDVCRDGLATFLSHFGLDAYEPEIRVWFTITGSYRTRGGTEEAATRDGEGYLGVDLSRLDDVIDDTEDFTVHVDRTDAIDD